MLGVVISPRIEVLASRATSVRADRIPSPPTSGAAMASPIGKAMPDPSQS